MRLDYGVISLLLGSLAEDPERREGCSIVICRMLHPTHVSIAPSGLPDVGTAIATPADRVRPLADAIRHRLHEFSFIRPSVDFLLPTLWSPVIVALLTPNSGLPYPV